MLVLSRRKGETIVIDDDIRITIVDINAKQVRLSFDAPHTVIIRREELTRQPWTHKSKEQ